MKWYERKPRRRGEQGDFVSPVDSEELILCPKCQKHNVVYNGNYFCDNWSYNGKDGGCTWALSHPAKSKKDRAFCDLIGIDYY